MRERVNRRHFLTAAAAAPLAASATLPVLPLAQKPLEFGSVRLNGGLLGQRFELNAKRTFSVPPADVLMPFFRAKRLSNGGRELNEGFLEWRQTREWPGLYSGFWMSGAAHIARWSGDKSHAEILARMPRELAKTKDSDGFVLAMGRDPKDRWSHYDLYSLVRVTVRCMLDIYELTGEKTALELARGQMDCMVRDILGNPAPGAGILLRGADPKRVEPSYYKLLPALAQLYRHTGDDRYLRVAEVCMDLRWMDMMIDGKRDLLPGRHASTWCDHLMGVYQIGLMTGKRSYTEFALKAAQRVREHHLFLTGSMSGNEEWRAGENGWQLPESNRAQETCCAAIWITLLESLLRGSGDMVHADCIERAALNALFSSQSPETGDFCYFVNLCGNGKPYDPPPEWGRHCCEGTGLMAIGRLPGLIYGATADGLAVNLYTPSEATAEIAGVRTRIVQRTDYPFEGTVRLRLDPARETRFSLYFRVPSWVDKPPAVEVNGAVWNGKGAITRIWKAGDEVLLRFDLKPRVVEDAFNGVPRAALCYGPVVMAATWEDDLPVRKAVMRHVVHGSHSHFEEWPYPPALKVEGALTSAFHRTPGVAPSFEAEAVTAHVPGVKSSPHAAKVRYVPFFSALRSKYSVWLPVHRRLS